ncbi:MAG: type II secretion system F family protein [Candidatus Marinimicrobia bacterium]|jgi:type IV pilus assembly protein PilC|nr:type II secretion system F family protein [Candidatus Neomarinimicrobiota bacterium]MDP6400491.1 type II secretion system F family protein [Candidatus Neomarinimicrobiota bacterium]MDP6819870.1 type II secretion system F family protein [Candidatus Neomarinimicrobiota bacterium]MED5427874.1 type II secretion system F family protein [Candidatus Neomarinimicrobiota bacterium]|tara:strand:- start:2 stop:1249 length:1248 start_codon:yes stop_codon:yes gene_type:complete
MSVFQYLIKDLEGKRQEGEIRAESLDLAVQKLTTGGQMVISLKEADDTLDFLGPFLDEIQLSIEKIKNRIPLSNIVFFTRQLATMFSAGLTLERAIQSLSVEEKHKKFKKILITVGDNIRKGMNLSESLTRHPGVFNNLFVAMTKAGEVSGNLNEILDQLASYLENLDDTRRKVKSAMNYPVFMVIFLGVMLSAMFLWIIPKFSDVYAQLGANLPLATRKLMEFSAWFSENAGLMIFVFLVFMFVLWLISKTQRGGFVLDAIKLKLPVFGALINQTILNKFCKTFGILLGAGVPVLESTSLLKKVVENKVYEKAIADASDYIRDGYNISTALRRTEVFPSILLQLASTGEDTGELDDLLDRAADYYQKQVNALVERMTTLIEPLLILVVGAVIALMVVLTYLPVFHLGSALQSGL